MCAHLQDSKLPTVFLLKKHYLDIVDDDWIMDALSDDGSVSALTDGYIVGVYVFVSLLAGVVDIDVPPPSLELDQENGSESPLGVPLRTMKHRDVAFLSSPFVMFFSLLCLAQVIL